MSPLLLFIIYRETVAFIRKYGAGAVGFVIC